MYLIKSVRLPNYIQLKFTGSLLLQIVKSCTLINMICKDQSSKFFSVIQIRMMIYLDTWILGYLGTWVLGVASKQLGLLHGRVGDSTAVVNSLSPQMGELVEDAIASWCGDIVGHFWLIRNGVEKFVELKFWIFQF